MRKVLIILVIVLSNITMHAQVPGFAIKIMGGINMPSFTMEQATAASNKMNYAFSLDAALGKKNYIQAGVSMRKYSGDFTVGSISSDLSLLSFGMHAYYGRQLLDAKAIKFRGFIGPNYELLSTPVSKDFTINKSAYNPSVFNLAAGVELKVLKVLLSLQYEFGLTDMMPNNSMKNNIFVAKIGISIL